MIRALLVMAALLVSSCELPSVSPADAGGITCFDDTDCTPNACCGMGTAVVHKSQAPDCTTVKCSGMCPINGIKCGCAVPVCRSQRARRFEAEDHEERSNCQQCVDLRDVDLSGVLC